MHRPVLVALAALAVAAFAVTGTLASAHPAKQATATVKIIQMKNGKYTFSRADITVKPNTKVTWNNVSGTDHTVTTNSSKLSIGDIPPGTKASLTFSKAGVYKYHCSFHSYMKGQITVKK